MNKVVPEDQPIVSFRAIEDSDRDFLRELYATTRAVEMEMVPWTDEQKHEFIDMQFTAQHTFYQEQFKQADFSIVQKNGENIGRLYLDHRNDETRIIDIALLPRYQRLGIGRQLLTDIIDAARERAVPVTIHVEKNNSARVLYDQLGFKLVEDQGVYDLMRWSK